MDASHPQARPRGQAGAALPRTARRPLRAALRALIWAAVVFVIFVSVLGGIGVLSSGRAIPLPVWLVAEAEARLNRAFDGQVAASVGGAEVLLGPDMRPILRLDDLRLMDGAGQMLARLPDVSVGLQGGGAAGIVPRPAYLRATGAQIMLRRGTDGRFDLALGSGAASLGGSRNLGALLDLLDDIFALPVLAGLERIEAEAVSITLDDRRSGRVWTVGDGRIALIQRDEDVVLQLGFGLVGGGSAPATANLSFVTRKGSTESRLSARIDQVAAVDIAAQAPALAWLGVIDAPISGDLRATIDAAGQVDGIEGALEFGAGALSPAAGASPVGFDRAGIRFAFAPGTDSAAPGRITFDDLSVDSAQLRLRAGGHAYVEPARDGAPASFLGQVQIAQVMVDPEGLFDEPVRFSEGALDLRLRLDPFSLDLGQVSLLGEGPRLLSSGRIAAGPEGWTVALDLALDAIRHDRLLALWPVSLVPRTREWLVANVQQGLLFDVRGALRMAPGTEPRLSLGYEFADADVRFIPTMPRIEAGHGHATIEGQTYTMVLDSGRVAPPAGGQISLTRSMFRVPDVTVKPALAELVLNTSSSITAALSLLDQPPFGFLGQAGIAVDLAEGQAELSAEIALVLAERIGPGEVDYRVTGRLTDVSTDRMAPGRTITAPELALLVDAQGVQIAGAGLLGSVPFDAVWRQDFGPPRAPGIAGAAPPLPERRGSTVSGRLSLSPAFAREFLPGLPQNLVRGEAGADFEIALAAERPARFSMRSDLRGAALRIDDIGWSKPAGAAGVLEIGGSLGTPVAVDRLVLSGPGLSATGSVRLNGDGSLALLALSDLRIADWLRGAAEIAGQGPGRPLAVRLTGGSADLRRMPGGQGAAGRGTGRGNAGGALSVALDRVTVTEGIALQDFRGDFSLQDGITGQFSGRLNGRAPVAGRVETVAAGQAFRITSDRAGQVLAAAGLFDKAVGGGMDLVLRPLGAPGSFDGTVVMSNVRVRNMPVLADLLNAVSIVGLLDQLTTSGLLFNTATAGFRLTPQGIVLRDGAAVGASIGVTLEGTWDARSAALDMRGVISPMYLVNGIGAVLTRPGEGVFGFNYTLRGPASRPEVRLNPFSVLAPGFLREIFRGPSARLEP